MPRRLGSHVRRLRRAAGLTQLQAADLAGLSVAALRDLEQGRVAAPRTVTLRRLAEALGLPAGESEELIRAGQPGHFPADNMWLQVLGPLTVHIDGARVEVGSPRQRLLLGALSLTPNAPVSQERLIEMIWGSQPPSNVADLLRGDAARLRRRLRQSPSANGVPEVSAAAGSYQLTVADDQLDLLLFRRQLDLARQAQEGGDPSRACRLLATAMELWRGEPLADLADLRDDPALVGLSREWQAAVVEYARTATGFGRHHEVLPLLRRVVERDPLHEAASAQLLLALTAAGQPGLAMAVFEQLRRRLAEEFGTDPGRELLEAYQLVREQHPARGPLTVVAARRQLPADLAEFTGREPELRTLQEWAALARAEPTAVPVLSIVGLGGSGKSRLAVHFGHRRLGAGDFPDGQLYVQLGEADPAATLAILLGLLGVEHHQLPPDLDGRAALYRDRLAGRRVLVLLDGATSAAQVLPLLPAGPGNLVLVTSRRVLGLAGVRTLALAELPPGDDHRLLARLAGADRVGAEPAPVQRLLKLCGGSPLAVSLAGRRLRARPTWRVADLVERLERAPDRLRELASGTDQLRAGYDRAYRELPPDGQRVLAAAAGSRPSAEAERETVAAAAAEVTAAEVATAAGLPAPAARRRLEECADACLLVPVPGGRYRVPPLLRAYLRSAGGPEPPGGGAGPAGNSGRPDRGAPVLDVRPSVAGAPAGSAAARRRG